MAIKPDVWKNVNLEEVFFSQSEKLDALQIQLDKAQKEANFIIGDYQAKLDAANAGLEVTQTLLDDLQQSGFSALYMEPKELGIFQRVAISKNKPQELDFSCGIFITFHGPSLSITTEKYKALLNILNS